MAGCVCFASDTPIHCIAVPLLSPRSRSNGYFIYGTVDGVSFQPKDVPVGPMRLQLVSVNFKQWLPRPLVAFNAPCRAGCWFELQCRGALPVSLIRLLPLQFARAPAGRRLHFIKRQPCWPLHSALATHSMHQAAHFVPSFDPRRWYDSCLTLHVCHAVSVPQGDGSTVAGLEEALVGSRAGTKLRVLVPPELGYTTSPGAAPQVRMGG